MTNPSHPFGTHPLTRARARRISRSFARVGVGIPALRLQAIAAGAPVAAGELTDFAFALVATETEREGRRAKLRQGRRRGIRWLISIGVTLAGLGVLSCVFLAIVSLALHTSPY